MGDSTTVASSASVYTTPVFWERLWRLSGINFVVFFIIAYVIYGHQPQVGASADALAAFYGGDRTRILIAAVFCMCNRYVDGLATWAPEDPAFYRQRAAIVAEHGYAAAAARSLRPAE